MKQLKRIPKLQHFKNKEEMKPFIVKQKIIITDVDAGISSLYHQMNPKNKLLKKGDKITMTYKPYAYFKFQGEIIPLYDDDAGQCACIYYDGEFIAGPSFTPDEFAVADFCYIINNKKEYKKFKEKEKKNEKRNSK